MEPQTLELALDGCVLHVRLNRPDVHNAFDNTLISELTALFMAISDMEGPRVVVLSGNGKSFCAGADINMMKRAAELNESENKADALTLAQLFHAINNCALPVIARVQGAALGGGMGLLACCDFAIAEAAAVFGFTEVKLGILPAVISPFVVAKIGASAARAHFTTGARFGAGEALRIGLVHRVVPDAAALDAAVDAVAQEYRTAAPGAVAAAKQLVRDLDVPNLTGSDAVLDLTAGRIAARRVSDEGQEGLRAFLERRKPAWHPEAASSGHSGGGAA